ncbi:ATP dependent DNA ligase [Rhizobium leguminosarum]|uniref:ATP dependent DNA ligase n=1 Tax=Rhizobium sp. BK008 TaxID=2587094 RepID=UPI00182681E5|nr:hypothetical protein [Rhizobium sp. BK008]MBB4255294.1 ATP-dependent DNA ligase [Rhizobium sp. BK008]
MKRLLLAQEIKSSLVYTGSIGTGFKERDLRELKPALDRLKVAKPVIPIVTTRKNLVFTKPTLYAEIQYRGLDH